jgi:hypothetical protein
MRRKIIVGAALFVVAILAAFISSPRRGIGPDAVRVLEVSKPVEQQGVRLAGGFVVLTNSTAKSLAIEILSIQAKNQQSTTNYNVFGTAQPMVVMRPHSSYKAKIAFFDPPPPGAWRFRLRVAEQVKGIERGFVVAESLVKDVGSRPPGVSIWAWARVEMRVEHYRHATEIVVGEDRDGPKMAGDRSVH